MQSIKKQTLNYKPIAITYFFTNPKIYQLYDVFHSGNFSQTKWESEKKELNTKLFDQASDNIDIRKSTAI